MGWTRDSPLPPCSQPSCFSTSPDRARPPPRRRSSLSAPAKAGLVRTRAGSMGRMNFSCVRSRPALIAIGGLALGRDDARCAWDAFRWRSCGTARSRSAAFPERRSHCNVSRKAGREPGPGRGRNALPCLALPFRPRVSGRASCHCAASPTGWTHGSRKARKCRLWHGYRPSPPIWASSVSPSAESFRIAGTWLTEAE